MWLYSCFCQSPTFLTFGSSSFKQSTNPLSNFCLQIKTHPCYTPTPEIALISDVTNMSLTVYQWSPNSESFHHFKGNIGPPLHKTSLCFINKSVTIPMKDHKKTNHRINKINVYRRLKQNKKIKSDKN